MDRSAAAPPVGNSDFPGLHSDLFPAAVGCVRTDSINQAALPRTLRLLLPRNLQAPVDFTRTLRSSSSAAFQSVCIQQKPGTDLVTDCVTVQPRPLGGAGRSQPLIVRRRLYIGELGRPVCDVTGHVSIPPERGADALPSSTTVRRGATRPRPYSSCKVVHTNIHNQ